MEAKPGRAYTNPERQLEKSEGPVAPERRIEEMSNFTVGDERLEAALKGEVNFVDRVLELSDAQRQLALATQVLIDTPYIKKYIPKHIIAGNHPAYLVAFIQVTFDKKNTPS